ncbi:MAG: DUF423 domain-containing protein [Bacteroidetes bacterium]|nr:DUF423 domain-containing protein [Bacteroidota bacterium]
MKEGKISDKAFIWAGSLITGTGVILGAMGAHWLRNNISIVDLQSFETGVRYQLIHGLAILILGVLPKSFQGTMVKFIFHAFWIGVMLFSGSIYLLATREVTMLQLGWLGPVTPVGGVFLITGWALLFFTSIRQVKEG